MSYTTQQIRNVALAGHPGAGKTILFEALLHAGGALQAAGTIERGNTASDHDPIEKERGHSVDAAIASIDYATAGKDPVHLNLVDTPGYPDFRGPTLSALAAVETVAVVVDADAGIGYGTRRMMEHAKARNLCRIIIVNRIDHEGADAAQLLDALREAFGPEVLPLNLPADGGKRVVDCFGPGAATSTETSDAGAVADWHRKNIDQVVEVNETVMDHFLDLGEGGLSGQELHDAFEQCLREGHLVPVCFTSARTGVGVKELLDIAAVAKVEEIHFDAVLHDSHEDDHIHLAPVAFPKPMFGLAVEAAHKGQEQKLSGALHKLSEEDPAFAVEHHVELNETVVRGLSDLHLRVMLDRLEERHGVEVRTRPPRIAYRETIGGRAEGHHRHKKQTGGAGQFGEVVLRIEPLPRGKGFEFVDEVKGGTIPGQFLPAVEKGVRQVLATGALAGYPMQDVRVEVYDVK